MDTNCLLVGGSRILYQSGRFATTMARRTTLTIMNEGIRFQAHPDLANNQVVAPLSSLSLTHAVRLPQTTTDIFLRKNSAKCLDVLGKSWVIFAAYNQMEECP